MQCSKATWSSRKCFAKELHVVYDLASVPSLSQSQEPTAICAHMLLQMEKFFRANQWEPIRLDSGEAATKQIGPHYEYGAKLDPGTGTPEEIEYLHLFVTATPIAIGTFD